MKNQELAILKDIHVGMRDCSYPVCWFSVEMISGGALQVISLEAMKKLIEEANVYKLEDLNNKPCIVEVENHIVKFVKMK